MPKAIRGRKNYHYEKLLFVISTAIALFMQ